MTPSHYLNQNWNNFNWTLGNELKWNINRNPNISIQGNAFQTVVCLRNGVYFMLTINFSYFKWKYNGFLSNKCVWNSVNQTVGLIVCLRFPYIYMLINPRFVREMCDKTSENIRRWHPTISQDGTLVCECLSHDEKACNMETWWHFLCCYPKYDIAYVI